MAIIKRPRLRHLIKFSENKKEFFWLKREGVLSMLFYLGLILQSVSPNLQVSDNLPELLFS